jgi:glycosyltransferase involved in cell wall biosynthesis
VEHVVIDACSTDGTTDIARHGAQRELKLISERDDGVYDAFNKGLREATGDVIAFLNADDFYRNDKVLETVASTFAEHDVDCVFGNVDFVGQQDLETIVRHYDSGAFAPSKLRMGFMPAHPATFIRKSLFDKIGGFDATYSIGGDFEFVARAFGRFEASYKYIPKTLTVMRVGGLSTRGISSKWTITKEIVRACKANGISTNYLWALSRTFLKAREIRL